jgi:hypothetical protein
MLKLRKVVESNAAVDEKLKAIVSALGNAEDDQHLFRNCLSEEVSCNKILAAAAMEAACKAHEVGLGAKNSSAIASTSSTACTSREKQCPRRRLPWREITKPFPHQAGPPEGF